VSLIWGATWLIIKYQVEEVPPSWSATWRFLVAGVVLFAYCLATGKRLRMSPAGHGFAALMGLMQFVLNFNFVYRAEEHVTSGLVALTFALLVVPNALFSWLFLGTRVSGQFVLGSAMGIAGVGAMFGRDIVQSGTAGDEVLLGLGLSLAALLSVSVANVLAASVRGRAQPLEGGIAWSMFYGTLMNIAIAWLLAGPPVMAWTPGYMGGLMYLSVAGSAVAFLLYYQMIRAMGAGRAAYSAVLIPIVALALSTLFEGYVWSGLAITGAALAICGLMVALRSR
uniref:DMT family transporter n=1 Tax=Polymorphobacter sp. TaxID=1909290 RepID=UPI003F6E52F3